MAKKIQRKGRPLGEKRIGLVIRMSFHRACVCTKRIQAPLLRCGWSEQIRGQTYKLTNAGQKAAKNFIKQYAGKHIDTYGGLSIGEVMIVQEPKY